MHSSVEHASATLHALTASGVPVEQWRGVAAFADFAYAVAGVPRPIPTVFTIVDQVVPLLHAVDDVDLAVAAWHANLTAHEASRLHPTTQDIGALRCLGALRRPEPVLSPV